MKINDILNYSVFCIKKNKLRTIMLNFSFLILTTIFSFLLVFVFKLKDSINLTTALNFINDPIVCINTNGSDTDFNFIADVIKIDSTYLEFVTSKNENYLYSLGNEKVEKGIILDNVYKKQYQIKDKYYIENEKYIILGFTNCNNDYMLVINDLTHVENYSKLRYCFFPKSISEYNAKIKDVKKNSTVLKNYSFIESSIIENQNRADIIINVILVILLIVIVLLFLITLNMIESLFKISLDENEYFYSLISILGSDMADIIKIQIFYVFIQSFIGIIIGAIISFFLTFEVNNLVDATMRLILNFGYDGKPILVISQNRFIVLYLCLVLIFSTFMYLISFFKVRRNITFKEIRNLGDKSYEK